MRLKQFLKISKDELGYGTEEFPKYIYWIGLPFVVLRFYIYKFTGGKF